ncbi:hypothetical protein JB92DRAFT_2812083 [Gautieria morchelliformis]|nr:hypothetical protein JB92DRAFT_2812083 [Gautieria morchelliformis]
MHPFGGTPKCPTCDKNVYAAEQAMGPGRRIYHKPCLKCVTCSRRLDGLSLLEHDLEPYCKSCHVRNFGTRDLRSANLTPSSPPLSPTRPTRSPSPLPASDSLSSNVSIPEEPGETEPGPEYESPSFPRPRSHTNLPASISFPRTAPSSLSFARRNSQPTRAAPILRPTARPLSPTKSYSARPLSPNSPGYSQKPLSPTSTGMSTASAPTYLRANTTGAQFDTPPRPSFTGNVGAKKTFGPSPGFGGTPSCPRCGKAVYFAEQVKASGRTWHKPCLRCTECSVLLDSTRITEKDGQIMCRSCYSKLHGPQGSGYALL